MLKKTVPFTNYNGEADSADLYFNISKAELMRLEMSTDGGYSGKLQRISSSDNNKDIYEAFEDLVGMSYGKKSDDGKRFEKSPEILAEFKESEAYSALIFSFFEDAGAAAEFAQGLMPQDLIAEAKKIAETQGTQTTEAPVLSAVSNEPIEVKDPSKMSREELMAAFKEKNQPNS